MAAFLRNATSGLEPESLWKRIFAIQHKLVKPRDVRAPCHHRDYSGEKFGTAANLRLGYHLTRETRPNDALGQRVRPGPVDPVHIAAQLEHRCRCHLQRAPMSPSPDNGRSTTNCVACRELAVCRSNRFRCKNALILPCFRSKPKRRVSFCFKDLAWVGAPAISPTDC